MSGVSPFNPGHNPPTGNDPSSRRTCSARVDPGLRCRSGEHSGFIWLYDDLTNRTSQPLDMRHSRVTIRDRFERATYQG